MKPFLALVAATLLACSVNAANAAPSEEMSGRYRDMQRCMEKAMGKGWEGKYDIDLETNQWGAEEPSGRDISQAPQVVRMTDLRCRRELGLAGQPRPD